MVWRGSRNWSEEDNYNSEIEGERRGNNNNGREIVEIIGKVEGEEEEQVVNGEEDERNTKEEMHW